MPYLQLQNKKLWVLGPVIAAALFIMPRFANQLLADNLCPSSVYTNPTVSNGSGVYGIFNGPDTVVQPGGTPAGGVTLGAYNAPVNSNTFTLSSDKQQYCLGDTPTYSLRASLSWANQTINWTSIHNGQTTSAAFTVDFSGGWSQQGRVWQPGDEGSWQKIARINGQSRTINLSVQNCGNYVPSQPNFFNGYNGPDTVFSTNGSGQTTNNNTSANNFPSTNTSLSGGTAERPGVSVGTGAGCVVTPSHECLY